MMVGNDGVVIVRNLHLVKNAGNPTLPVRSMVHHTTSHDNYDDYDDYGTHYGEFAGSYAQDVMGYSDDVINDAFEGDPDACWNID